MLLFCNTNDNGDIQEILQGERVVPARQYDFFFYLNKETDAETIAHLDDYKVDLTTRQLVPKEAD